MMCVWYERGGSGGGGVEAVCLHRDCVCLLTNKKNRFVFNRVLYTSRFIGYRYQTMYYNHNIFMPITKYVVHVVTETRTGPLVVNRRRSQPRVCSVCLPVNDDKLVASIDVSRYFGYRRLYFSNRFINIRPVIFGGKMPIVMFLENE